MRLELKLSNQPFWLIFSVSILALLNGICMAAERNQIVQDAVTLFNQRKPAITELRVAAETGDSESQFYFAEALRIQAQSITPEALRWYEKSADQGDLYAMFRLAMRENDLCVLIGSCSKNNKTSEEWLRTLCDTAQARANDGDGSAMEMMYMITGSLGWLIKASAVDHPEAQWWLAIKYREGKGFFWPGQREAEVERLLRASAVGGYPQGISEYAALLLSKGDVSGAQKWLLKGVSMSYADAVGAYAYSLEYGKYYSVEIDLEKAYSLNLILTELDGGGMAGDMAAYALDGLREKLSARQIEKATQAALDWKSTHPPISYYPAKLEF